MGQSLDVLDQGGPATHAPYTDRLKTDERRDGGSAVQRAHHGGLLTGDESIRGADHLDLHGVQTMAPPRLDSPFDAVCEARRDVDNDPRRSECCRSRRGPVEDEMGHTRQEERVLRTGRLPFGAVGHHHGPPCPPGTDRPPLGGHRNPGPAVAN